MNRIRRHYARQRMGTYEYDVFGTVRAQTGATTEWSYTGEQNDPTGLEYLRARYYDASTGRFLSQDPLPLLQRYAYANDNPANLVDPSGLTPFAELMAAERAVQAAARQILSDPCWKTRAFCKHVALVWKTAKPYVERCAVGALVGAIAGPVAADEMAKRLSKRKNRGGEDQPAHGLTAGARPAACPPLSTRLAVH